MSAAVLRDPGELGTYSKMHGLSSIERSPQLLRDTEKFIIYCKNHESSSIEQSYDDAVAASVLILSAT